MSQVVVVLVVMAVMIVVVMRMMMMAVVAVVVGTRTQQGVLSVAVLPPLAAAITSQPVLVSAPSNEPHIMISTPTTRRGTESGVVTKRAPARAC